MSEATKNQLAEEQAEKAAAAQTAAKAAEEQAEKGKNGKKGKEEKAKDKAKSGRTAPEEYGPDVTIHVPIDKLNPGLTEIPVHINEYSWMIKRGEKQIVPEAVADVLHQAGYL